MRRVDIDAAWPEFRALVAPVLAGEDDQPEHIRDACRNGEAWLLECEEGFVVLQHCLRPGTQCMQLLIWLAVSRGAQGCIERRLPFIQDLGRKLGVSRVLFRTRRRGFARALPEEWKQDHVVWSWEVDDVQG